MAMPKGSLELEGPPNRRRPRESPRGSSRQGDGEGLRPRAATRNGAGREGFGLRERLRESGKAFGRSRDPKGDFGRFRPRGLSSRGGTASAQRLSKGRPEGLRPRCEPKETARLRPGSIRQGSEGGMQILPDRPDGDRRGAFSLSAETHRVPNGASRPRSGIRGKRSGRSRPPRNPKPPSERWPRHPATAVKAGTSGGRWRHRPPL